VDFCDNHFDWMHNKEFLRLADVVTCPTEAMAAIIKELGRDAVVIPDPYEYPEVKPHCDGICLVWYGHASNKESLDRVLPEIAEYPLRVISNFEGSIPWSFERMFDEFREADIVILPATEKHKSANRAVEAIRQGCYVVAEPHPAIMDIPGIWIGNIKEGIEWARQHPRQARQHTSMAQRYVAEKYSPKILASAWRKAIQWHTTSDVETSIGTAGSMSI
jgi:hypothetical protein